MRLNRLTLDRFGHFTDKTYDFGAKGDRPDFHIIYGSNEAGKTTTMEAALRLFYGFPTRDPYAFKHPRSNLQISAQLDIDGNLRQFTRLPKRSGALLDEAGTVLPEAALTAHLGGLSDRDYRSLLCLDDETIEQGGEEIAQAKGDIGRLLFSAAAGVSDLSSVLDKVRGQADEIWRKRASKTRIAELKRALAEVDKSIRDGDTSAGAWRSLKKAAKDTKAAEQDAKVARDAVLERQAINAAKTRALPVLAEITALNTRIAPYNDYPQHLDFDPERLVHLATQHSATSADITRLTDDIDAMVDALDGLTFDPKALELTLQLDALKDLSVRNADAGLDLERRRAAVVTAKDAMRRAADDLDVAQDVDLADLVLSPAAIARLDAARETLKSAQSAAEAEAREVADLKECCAVAQEALEQVHKTANDDANVTDILAQFDLDRLIPAVAKAEHAIASAKTQARDALRTLGPNFENIPPCPTSLVQAQNWLDQHSDLAQKISQAQTRLAQHREDADALNAQRQALTATGGFMSDAEAKALQDERDALWQAHQDAANSQTAQAFEQAMQAVDNAVAARLSQASDLGRLRQIEQDQAASLARAKHSETQLQALQDESAAIQTQVDSAAQHAGLSGVMRPTDWRDWVQAHGQAEAAAVNLSDAQDTHQPVLDRAADLLDALSPFVSVQSLDFEGAVSAARQMARTEQDQQRKAQNAQEALATLQSDLERRAAKHIEKQKHAEACAAQWQDLVTSLLGGSVRADALLAALTPLRDLREHNDKRSDVARRVALMETDQAQFKTSVAELAEQYDQPQSESAAQTYSALQRYAETTQAAQSQTETLTENLAKARAHLQDKQEALEGIAQEVATLGRLFPQGAAVDTLDALRRTVSQAQQVILARAERAKLERAICADLDVDGLEAAQAVLAQTSMAALDAQREALKADVLSAEQQMTQATEARVTAQQALAQVTGDASIASLTERKATLELELEEAALEYMELTLGHRLAEDAIRRYRDTHRSDMMAATERCFATLTHGAYPRLITQPDGDNETLLAVDAQGGSKRAVDMSKGTRFQLYLALRAAAHEQLVAQGTCLPFFCDDIFETFDEDRTRAACRVMEQIGRSGQAIYLTHHKHVVEIAQEVCDTPPTVHYV